MSSQISSLLRAIKSLTHWKTDTLQLSMFSSDDLIGQMIKLKSRESSKKLKKVFKLGNHLRHVRSISLSDRSTSFFNFHLFGLY